MIKKIYICIFIYLFLFYSVSAQQHYTISGFIRDAKTGEELIGATVSIKELPGKGVATNAYGFYSITLPSGNYQVKSQYVGYGPISEQILLNKSLKLNFTLNEAFQELQEVVITSEKNDENVTKIQMGLQKLDTK